MVGHTLKGQCLIAVTDLWKCYHQHHFLLIYLKGIKDATKISWQPNCADADSFVFFSEKVTRAYNIDSITQPPTHVVKVST